MSEPQSFTTKAKTIINKKPQKQQQQQQQQQQHNSNYDYVKVPIIPDFI